MYQTAYGLFNDEGMVDGPFYSLDEARRQLSVYDEEDEISIDEICPDHEGHAAHSCELCHED